MTDVRIVVTAVGDMAPVAGIGKPFQIGVVLADGWELGTSDRTYLPGGPALDPQIQHPLRDLPSHVLDAR